MLALVTGCAGFIGSCLSVKLLEGGWEVIGIDNMDSYYEIKIKQDNLRKISENDKFQFFEADIIDIENINIPEPQNLDMIFHLAAKAGVSSSFKAPDDYAEVNIIGTVKMLNFARKHGIEKFIFASSSSVYGDDSQIPYKEDEADLNPISPYGISKLTAERYCRLFTELYGLKINALRFFTVYGPGQRPDMAINKFIHSMIDGRSIDIYGDGSMYRDYTYIDDIISGVIGATEHFQGFSIFNLGNNNPTKLLDMVNSISEILDVEPDINFVPAPPGEMKGTYADIELAKKFLGFKPKTEFKKGLAEEIDWIKNL